jgi:GT2 family glycosyltransferase
VWNESTLEFHQSPSDKATPDFHYIPIFMNTLVSICIPTYRRPELLMEAVRSCLSQTYQNIEIVISDDSPDDLSQQSIEAVNHAHNIRYCRNPKALGQAGNVNQLFALARGTHLVLLHDDDLLLPNAVNDLLQVWERYPDIVVCYGKQYMIDMPGHILKRESIELNDNYYRTPVYEGLQFSPITSALRGQLPNDAYMILTDAARSVGYSDHPEVGDICDYEFGLRLAAQYTGFYLIDQYVASYRLTDCAISKNNNHDHLSYELIAGLKLPQEAEETRSMQLQHCAPTAINKYLQLGERQKAKGIYFSAHNSWRNRLTMRGLIQIIFLYIIPAPVIAACFRVRIQVRDVLKTT